jgi:hypothetical protein
MLSKFSRNARATAWSAALGEWLSAGMADLAGHFGHNGPSFNSES